MVSLQNISIGGIKLPPRIVAYGTDGIGKSTWASQSEKPIFIPTEDGSARLNVPQFPVCREWSEVFECLRVIYSEKHDYKTLVIDTADWAQNLAQEHVIDTDYKGDVIKYNAYGAGYKSLMREWRKFIDALDKIHCKRRMTIILLLHATIKRFSNPMGEDYDIYKANLIDSPNTSIYGVTKEWADLVLFLNKEVLVSKDQTTAKKKAVMKKTRFIHTQPNAAYDAKVRAGWNLPDKLDLDYATFDMALNGNKIETETETEIEERTDENGNV